MSGLILVLFLAALVWLIAAVSRAKHEADKKRKGNWVFNDYAFRQVLEQIDEGKGKD